MSNLGKWERWYSLLGAEPRRYGDSPTYRLGAEWLADCALVEDWGCGMGWLRTLVEPGRYRGIDGSRSRFADAVVDLATYRSDVPGVFIRHVLEHDFRWRDILDNAVASARERLVLVLFTPLVPETRVLSPGSTEIDVPDIAFSEADLVSRFGGAAWYATTLASETQYGTETIFFLRKEGA